MDWFDPSDDVVLKPEVERSRFWKKKYGVECIEVAPQVIYANNGHGRLFDSVCLAFDETASIVHDFRHQGYCHYQVRDAGSVTIYQAPERAPYAAADLEFLISAGAHQIVFLNGAGSLQPQAQIGSILLPQQLIREEGTSYHYVPPDVILSTNKELNERISEVADKLDINLLHGPHWTTDAIYRETFSKVEKFRRQGVISVEMELSALAGVAYFRKFELSAILIVTDMVSRFHTWGYSTSARFQQGVKHLAQLARCTFPHSLEN